MQLKHLALAGAASLLMAGVAYAQPSSSTAPSTGAPPNPSSSPSQTPSANPPGGQTTSPSTGASTPDTSGSANTGAAGNTSGTAPSADVSGSNASVTTTVTTNGPIPDTPENRRKFGAPLSRAGKLSPAKGN
jgi:hypothetical protein